MSKTAILLGLLAVVLLGLLGLGGYAYVKIQDEKVESERKAAAFKEYQAEKAATKLKAEQEALREELNEARGAARRERQEREELEGEQQKAADANRDAAVDKAIETFAFQHYADHKEAGSIYTWGYEGHTVQKRVVKDNITELTVKIRATAEPPIGNTRHPTSTYELSVSPDGDVVASDLVGQTK